MPVSGYLMKQDGILPTSACIAFATAFFTLFAYAIYSCPSAADIARESKTLYVHQADAKRLRPVVIVTIGWSALYYCFLQGQAASAFWIHKIRRERDSEGSPKVGRQMKPLDFADVKYGTQRNKGEFILTMDRSVGNLLEQTPPFLLALWLHALLVSSHDAASLGWVWLLLRASYPLAFAHPSWSPSLWGVQRSIGISWVSFVTWPSYAIVWTLLGGVAKACW